MSAIYDRVQRRKARVERVVGSKATGGTVDFELWLQDAAEPLAEQVPIQIPTEKPTRGRAKGDGRPKQLTIIAIPSGHFVDDDAPRTKFYKTPPAAFMPDGTPIWSPKAGYLVLSGLTAAPEPVADIDLDETRTALGVEASPASLAELDGDKAKHHASDTPNPAVANIEFETDEQRAEARKAEVAEFEQVLKAHRSKFRVV
ncbi:hypothetical protein [Neoaquamicrobium sediminum]|uniref:hypothetical protein n=1 Tax=Neoaquamicrobium sediminum TaxID=1849104 RepID=UPI0040366029